MFLYGLLLWLMTGGTQMVVAQSGPDAADPFWLVDPQAAYMPGEILVGYRPQQIDPVAYLRRSRSATPQLAEDADVYRAGQLLDVPGLYLTLPDVQAGEQVQGMRLYVPVGQELALVQELSQTPGILFAEPNWIVRASAEPVPFIPNDPLFKSAQWEMRRIDAARGWAITQGGPVQIAILDTGIDFNHPEFQGRLLPGKNYLVPSLSPQDQNGHGTHVAGLLAAGLNNGLGIAGLAPNVFIDPRQVLGTNGFGVISNIAQALIDVSYLGTKIVNMSFEYEPLNNLPPSVTLLQAINIAANQDILLIASSGNEGKNKVLWPAAYDNVLAVGSTTRGDLWASYSNYGPELDLVAPGGQVDDQIISTWPGNTFCQNIFQPQSSYCTAYATSMSAPLVSGAAALIRGYRPDLSAVQTRQILLDSAHRLDENSQKVGRGRLDVRAALRLATSKDLTVTPAQIVLPLTAGVAHTVTVDLTLINPSDTPLQWEIRNESRPAWLLILDGAGAPTTSRSGAVTYQASQRIPLRIQTSVAMTGAYDSVLTIYGTGLNGQSIRRDVAISLKLVSQLRQQYLPVLVNLAAPYRPFRWESPDANGKQRHFLLDESSQSVSLPFSFRLGDQSVTTARFHANGFLALPFDATIAAARPGSCLNGLNWPTVGVFGWWADLNPELGGRITTFRTLAQDGFVVEYESVPAVGGGAVTFQMVLYANGQVGLNYRSVPVQAREVVAGVSAGGGLLYRQIGCAVGGAEVGHLPESGQSLLLGAADLY